jgi:hypothetical protein
MLPSSPFPYLVLLSKCIVIFSVLISQVSSDTEFQYKNVNLGKLIFDSKAE